MSSFELDFVEWLRERGLRNQGSGVLLGIGDDMAIVDVANAPGGRLLLTSDMVLEGVHFDVPEDRPGAMERIGRKAIACSLSDCAAMAVRPLAATVSIALPPRLSTEAAQKLYAGMTDIAGRFGLAIVGGDTNRWRQHGGPLIIDVTIAAVCHDGVAPVTRSGARPGDALFVTGQLGGSRLGRHLDFTPRVREARLLAMSLGDRLHAMIDSTDGLALDLWRVCQSSEVGATLEESLLADVISDDARRVAESGGTDPLQHALTDGEDFELLLAVAGDSDAAGIAPDEVDGVTLLPVGTITDGPMHIRRTDGTLEPLEPEGYIH